MTLDQEKEWIAKAKKDPHAFGEVFDAYFDSLFRYTLHRTANVAVAEDLTSQTFFHALRSLWKFRWSGVPLSAWLYRIANNEINGYLRSIRKRAQPCEPGLAERLPDGRHPPDRELMEAEAELARKQDFLKLHACIGRLKPIDQALIVLRFFESKPFAEIARILRKKEGSLRMRVVRALDRLKKDLRDQEMSDEEIRRIISPAGSAPREGGYVSAKPATQST